MLKNTKSVFLAMVLAMTLIIIPVGATQVSAQTISDSMIRDQEQVAQSASRTAIEQYARLLVYMVIMRLEAEIARR